jgi:hypothetical protein
VADSQRCALSPVWAKKIHVANAKGGGQLIDRYDGWISKTFFQPTDVLLTKAGKLGELFLRKPFSFSHPPDISPD